MGQVIIRKIIVLDLDSFLFYFFTLSTSKVLV